jgi:hypothetical protein
MRRTLTGLSIGIVVLIGLALLNGGSESNAQQKEDTLLSHDVYFSLKDNSPEAKKKLVDACKKYLSGHEGEVFFSAGVRAAEFKRDVNDQHFDVALQIVFKDIKSHDKYQDAKRHLEFIAENKGNWTKVRVFDSLVQR